MTATQQFIEDAIKGGWKSDCKGVFVWANKVTHTGTSGFNEQSLTFYEILLDPLAWQAVGKARGWNNEKIITVELDYSTYRDWTEWEANWHRFIDHCAIGKSIEEALKVLTTEV